MLDPHAPPRRPTAWRASPRTGSASLLVFALLAVLAGLAPMPADAMVVRPLALEDLEAGAAMIVRGRVVVSRSLWIDARIYTAHRVDLVTVWKGEAEVGDELIVHTLGGVVGGMGMAVCGEAQLRRGDDVILFLRRAADRWRVYGFAQGRLDVAPAAVPAPDPAPGAPDRDSVNPGDQGNPDDADDAAGPPTDDGDTPDESDGSTDTTAPATDEHDDQPAAAAAAAVVVRQPLVRSTLTGLVFVDPASGTKVEHEGLHTTLDAFDAALRALLPPGDVGAQNADVQTGEEGR